MGWVSISIRRKCISPLHNAPIYHDETQLKSIYSCDFYSAFRIFLPVIAHAVIACEFGRSVFFGSLPGFDRWIRTLLGVFVLRVYAIYQGSKKIIVASLALAAVLVPIAAVSPFLK